MRPIWPFRHLALKIVSLVLAAMLWIIIAGEETIERGMRVPLELRQFPAELELQGEAPLLVDVRLRGASGTLSRLGAGDIAAVLDLHGARPGRRLYQLTPDQVRVPFGVEVVQVTPQTVPLAFENSASRMVPVVPAVEGDPAPGYVVGRLVAEPKSVEVVGPESAIERLREAVTEPVSIAGATQAVTDSVSVGLLDPAVRLKSARVATVTVEIVPGPEERTLHRQAVHLRNLGAKLRAQASPNVVDVVLRGGRQRLGRVNAEHVEAFVDLLNLGSGAYVLPVHVAAREAGIVRIDPAIVQVRISSTAADARN
jgi:YbbR domain-containing protein